MAIVCGMTHDEWAPSVTTRIDVIRLMASCGCSVLAAPVQGKVACPSYSRVSSAPSFGD